MEYKMGFSDMPAGESQNICIAEYPECCASFY